MHLKFFLFCSTLFYEGVFHFVINFSILKSSDRITFVLTKFPIYRKNFDEEFIDM